MNKTGLFILACCLIPLAFHSCKTKEKKMVLNSISPPGSFGYDLEFLKKTDQPVVLKNASGTAQVIVSPKYQGKVFTSTAKG